MNASSPTRHSAIATIEHDAIFVALADAMTLAETYSRTAVDMASVRDARGAAYAARSASAALLSAVGLLDEIRPSHNRQGGRT